MKIGHIFSRDRNRKLFGLFLFASMLGGVSFIVTNYYPANVSPVMAEVKVAAGTDLCAAGGEAADNILTAGETSFDNTQVEINGCTFSIDGTHTFTGIDVLNGGTLTHSANTTTHPNITITSNMNIDGTSSINVTGKGCPGEQGYNEATDLCADQAGEGYGPNSGNRSGGGGHGGEGGRAWEYNAGGSSFGVIDAPDEYGGGGGEYATDGNGGAGGGKVRLNITGTLTVNGSIISNGSPSSNTGGNRGGGAGAGGSIYITTDTITTSGSGLIQANGGIPAAVGQIGGAGGGGRIAVIYTTADTFTGSGTYEAFGKDGGYNNTYYGGAGTVFIKQSAASAGDITFDNNITTAAALGNTYLSGSYTFDDILIKRLAYVIAKGPVGQQKTP